MDKLHTKGRKYKKYFILNSIHLTTTMTTQAKIDFYKQRQKLHLNDQNHLQHQSIKTKLFLTWAFSVLFLRMFTFFNKILKKKL